jgi:hypothetical protein
MLLFLACKSSIEQKSDKSHVSLQVTYNLPKVVLDGAMKKL